MSRYYDDIIVGPSFSKLQRWASCPEIAFKKYADLSVLRIDHTGDYTASSLDNAYGNEDAVFNVLLNYKELCSGSAQ